MTGRQLALTTLLGAVLTACSSEPPAEEHDKTYQVLVGVDEWTSVARDADPFIADLDDAPACVGPGFFVEDDWVEVDTGLCNWVTLQGSARFAVEPGQALRLVVSHYDLSASAPAEAELGLRLGICDAWQKRVPIPSPATVYTEQLEAPCQLEKGASLQYHLHNHGQNNRQLQEFSVLR